MLPLGSSVEIPNISSRRDERNRVLSSKRSHNSRFRDGFGQVRLGPRDEVLTVVSIG